MEKNGRYLSVGRGGRSSLSQFQIRSSFLRRCSWHWNTDNRLGKFHTISALVGVRRRWAPEAAEVIMPTCGMSRHRLLAGAQTQQRNKSLNGSERKIEGKTERERRMEHTWPLRYSVVFQTLLWKNRGAGGQSITVLACSYKRLLSVWAASMPPAVHALWEGRAGGQDRPLEGAPVHQSNQLLVWNQDSLPAYEWGRKGRSDPWCHWDRRPGKGKQFAHMVCLLYFFSFFFFNNIEHKDQTVLPVGRSRCASHADEGLLSNLH